MGNQAPSPDRTNLIMNRTCYLPPYNENEYCLTMDEYIGEILADLRPTAYEVALLVMYCVVLVAGLLGNALVVMAVLRTPAMRNATNLCLLNLALADFLVILLCLVPTVIEDIMESWVFGDLACRVLKYLQPVSVTVSVLTMTFNSVERLLAICFPLKFKTTKRRICICIVLIWTIAMVSKLQYPFTMETQPHLNLSSHIVLLTACRSNWQKVGAVGTAIDLDVGSSIVDSVLFFVLPFAWMLVAYSLVCRRLWHAAVPGASPEIVSDTGGAVAQPVAAGQPIAPWSSAGALPSCWSPLSSYFSFATYRCTS